MKINDIKVTRIEKWVTVNITYRKTDIEFLFRTLDGKVNGDYDTNMATSYLNYFNSVSDKIRKSHFKFLKNYIEKMIPQKQ